MKSTRREWIAGCAAAGLLGAADRYRPVLSAQFYIWVQRFEREGKTLAEGVAEALETTRRAGFRRIELMASLFAADVRDKTFAAIEKSGMEVPIVYHGGPLHEPAAAEKTIAGTLELAGIVKRTGARIINFNPDPKPGGARKTDDELAAEARAATELAKALEPRRFQLILHHHSPEMAEEAREWHYLLRNTEIPLCVDTHWVYRGGQNPLSLLEEAGRRVRSIHLRNSRQGVWSEDLSDGDVDYRKIAAYLKQTAYSGYLVVELAYDKETRITRPLEEDLRRSRQYASEVFGFET